MGGGLGRIPVLAQDHQAVPAQARFPELHRGDPARLQSVRPPRQHPQGAHQDPGAPARRGKIHRRGRGRMARDQGRRRWRSTTQWLPTSPRASAIPTTRGSPTIRRSSRAPASEDRGFRHLVRQFRVQPQGAGLRDRHAVAEADRRHARRCHRRADGHRSPTWPTATASAKSASAMSRTWCCRMSPSAIC